MSNALSMSSAIVVVRYVSLFWLMPGVMVFMVCRAVFVEWFAFESMLV